MVKLSAATVAIDESENYEVSEGVKAYVEPTEDGGEATSGDGDNEREICNVPCRRVRALLLKDLTEEAGIDYAEGANIEAWVDDSGDVLVYEDDWDEPVYLEPEEIEIVERFDGGDVDADAILATSDAGDNGGNWQAEALAKIKEARQEVAERENFYLQCKEVAKNAKTAWEAAVTELTDVIDSSTETLPLFDRQPTGFTVEISGATNCDVCEEWRSTPIDVLFSGIERFGAKKQDTVRDAIPTLGAFEDLRKKASLAGDPLKEHMPKGIGQDTCDQLEEAALNWIAARMREASGGGDAEAS